MGGNQVAAGCAFLVSLCAGVVAVHPAVAPVLAGFAGALFGAAAVVAVWPLVRRWCRAVGIAETATALSPVVVAAGAGLSAAAALAGTAQLVVWLSAVPFAVWAAVIDSRTHRIPSVLVGWLTVVVLVCGVGIGVVTGEMASLVRAIGVSVAITLGYLLFAVVSRGMVGLGDVRLSFPLALIGGYLGVEVALAGAVLTYLVWFPFVALPAGAGRRSLTGSAAAAPFMVAGTVAALTRSTVLVQGILVVDMAAAVLAALFAVPRLLRTRRWCVDRVLVVTVFVLGPAAVCAVVACIALAAPLPVFYLAIGVLVVVVSVAPIAGYRLRRGARAAAVDDDG